MDVSLVCRKVRHGHHMVHINIHRIFDIVSAPAWHANPFLFVIYYLFFILYFWPGEWTLTTRDKTRVHAFFKIKNSNFSVVKYMKIFLRVILM